MPQFERQFSTGSIEAPDEFDKHLDSIGYYRKHTARDATCLFRVISEQMYSAQIYHYDIRDICVRYMGMHENVYKEIITTDLTYEEYLAKLSRPKSFGSLAELHALAYRFKRNVLLFDPHTSGNWYVNEPHFTEIFLVFYTPPKHFDSVFPKSYMESVAFCQSLTYEILYSHVFKLPDVVYAVERMLHDPIEGTHVNQIEVSPYDGCQDALTLSDGRYFILDHADETECILKNYLFCHFHNKQFDTITSQLRDDFYANQHDPEACANLEHVFGALLPRRNVSCVRQLLDENITPFSYKVAKALDTHIYRNIEFDVWNEARRNIRFRQWSQGNTLQVGIKCLVENIDRNQESPYYCHIQEMSPHNDSCVVFVETLGDYRTVPFSAIKKLPKVSWMVPCQGNQRSEKKKKRNWPTNESYKSKNNKFSKIKEDDPFNGINYFTKTLHIPQQYCEYIAQPHHNSNRFSKNDENGGGNNQPTNKNVQAKKGNTVIGDKLKTENNKNATVKRAGTTAETKSGKSELLKVEYEPHYVQQNSMVYTNMDTNAALSNFNMERGEMENVNMPNISGHNHSFLYSMIKQKELLRSTFPPNLNAQPSYQIDGSDLQKNDVSTVRFFYNLGHEYLRYMQYRFPAKAVASMFHNIVGDNRSQRYSYYDSYQDVNDLANDFNRCVSFQREQQYQNKPNEPPNQYRRSFNPNTVNGPKKNSKSYRSDYNKNKRQFGDPEASTKYQHPNNYKTSTDYSDTGPISDTMSRATDADLHANLMTMPPPQLLYYHSGDTGDPRNMYGVDYGMYTPDFAPYAVPVQGGMIFPESLTDEDMAQTYPYYNPAYYYSTPMAPYQMGGHNQGPYYSQPFMPIPSNMAQPIQSSGTSMPVSIAPPISTPTYAHYVVAETNDNSNNTNATTTLTFTQNEP